MGKVFSLPAFEYFLAVVCDTAHKQYANDLAESDSPHDLVGEDAQRAIDPHGWLSFGKEKLPETLPNERTLTRAFQRHLAPLKPTRDQVKHAPYGHSVNNALYYNLSRTAYNLVLPSTVFISKQYFLRARMIYGETIVKAVRTAGIRNDR